MADHATHAVVAAMALVKPRYVGSYGPPLRDLPAVATMGNLVIYDAVTLLHTPGLAEAIRRYPHLNLVVQLHILDEVWAGADVWPGYQLEHIDAGLAQAGLLDRLRAIILDEECLSGAYSTRFHRLPTVAAMDTLGRIAWAKAGLERAARLVRAVFPGVPLGHVETCWHDGLSFGPAYYRPIPQGLDFLGLDAYVHGPVTRAAFDRQVRPILSHLATLPYDVLLVPQAFSDQDRVMPTREQVRWWLEAAPPRTAGVAFFAPTMPEGGRGYLTDDAMTAGLRWYGADYCGVVPESLRVR